MLPADRTLLMTDVVASTPLWETDPSAMERALATHDRCIFEAVERRGGRTIRSRGEGDSTFSVFEHPVDALAAAIEAQRALGATAWETERPIRVRMAVYLGEAKEWEGDLRGTAPNRAARLRSMAGPGEVVIGQRAAEVARPRLEGPIELVDLGVRHLRGVDRPERVFAVVHPDLRVERPSWRGEAGELIGRDDELVQIASLLETRRHVTITGVGGVGKTRVARALSTALNGAFPDGVWMVELASVTESGRVVGAMLEAVSAGLAHDPAVSELDQLVATIGDADGLFVVDNCEHLVDTVAQVVIALTSRCHRIRILATSRRALGLSGERLFSLRPLGVPEASSLEAVANNDAVRLLVSRASLAGVDLTVNSVTVDPLYRICRLLDGIPLAIELAAARLRTMMLVDLMGRLENEMTTTLAKGPRDVDQRQRTMRATLDWSYRLLDGPGRAIFRRLGVFIGGFTLAAAQEVSPGETGDPRDLLELLVEDSLVQFSETTGRYWMLEPVRQYAIGALEEEGELAEAQELHSAWVVAFAEKASHHFMADQAAWSPLVRAERGNIEAAIERALAGSGDITALRIVGALGTAWFTTGEPAALRWAELALEGAGAAPIGLRARAMLAAGLVAQQRVHYDRSVNWLEQAVAYYRMIDKPAGLGWSLFFLARALVVSGRSDNARELFEEAGTAFKRVNDQLGQDWAGVWKANFLAGDGDVRTAATIFRTIVETSPGSNPAGEALRALAGLAMTRGDSQDARLLAQQAVDDHRRSGDQWQLCAALQTLVDTCALTGDMEKAVQSAREALDIADTMRFDDQLVAVFRGIADLAATVDPTGAATLLSASRSRATQDDAVMAWWGGNSDDRLRTDSGLDEARLRGLRLNRRQALDLARELLSHTSTTR
jgi:predicted ATPase/class 3 adenylate cyclase